MRDKDGISSVERGEASRCKSSSIKANNSCVSFWVCHRVFVRAVGHVPCLRLARDVRHQAHQVARTHSHVPYTAYRDDDTRVVEHELPLPRFLVLPHRIRPIEGAIRGNIVDEEVQLCYILYQEGRTTRVYVVRLSQPTSRG